MADISDVEAALVTAVTAIAYPNGLGTPSAFGGGARIYRGLPASACLLDDRNAGIVDVSIVPEPGRTRDTTRWGVQVFDIAGSPGLTVESQNNSATFYGTALVGDLAGALVDGTAYVYAAQPGDAAALAAAALADAIRTISICWLTNATLTVPGCKSLIGRTAAPATALEEWGRQEQDFHLSVWAPTPQLRDAACRLICGGLASISFLTLADGTGGRLRYRATASNDDDQASCIYRRTLTYVVEYGTTVTRQSPCVLFGDLNLNGRTILV